MNIEYAFALQTTELELITKILNCFYEAYHTFITGNYNNTEIVFTFCYSPGQYNFINEKSFFEGIPKQQKEIKDEFAFPITDRIARYLINEIPRKAKFSGAKLTKTIYCQGSKIISFQ